jgi:hypothetical protein
MRYVVEMAHTQSFMKIGTGVQAILSPCLSNLKCCNTGITKRRQL